MANMMLDALGGMLPKAMGLGGNNAVNKALQVFNSLKGTPDYISALKAMAGNDPQIAKALDVVNQSNGDSKAAFMKLAEQFGIEPNTILNLIK